MDLYPPPPEFKVIQNPPLSVLMVFLNSNLNGSSGLYSFSFMQKVRTSYQQCIPVFVLSKIMSIHVY